MSNSYKVKSFVPTLKGCGASDNGWDSERCLQFESFINEECGAEWKLHSYEYRQTTVHGGCGKNSGNWLVCVFEKLT